MATTETRMTTERLDAFMDAWNAHDVDGIVSFFADDCVFHPSVGTELMGGTYVGKDEVRRGSPRSSSATRTAASTTRAVRRGDRERPSGRSFPATRRSAAATCSSSRATASASRTPSARTGRRDGLPGLDADDEVDRRVKDLLDQGLVRRRDSRLPRHCSRVGMISIPPNTTTCFPVPFVGRRAVAVEQLYIGDKPSVAAAHLQPRSCTNGRSERSRRTCEWLPSMTRRFRGSGRM